MPQITATIEVPITVNWSRLGVADGETPATAVAKVTRTVDEADGWSAVGNWSEGQDTATITEGGGSESGGGGGPELGDEVGGG